MKTPGKINNTVFFLVCFFVIARCEFVSAQLSFQKTYNLKSETVTISQPDDQGGIVTAGTYLGEQGNSDLKISLSKFDKHGKVIWSKYYRDPGKNLRLVSFILAENGDYMLAGFVIPKDDQSRYEIFLLRIDKNGNIIWSRNFYKDYRSVFYSLGRSADKGFFLYANYNEAPAGLGYNMVLKVDQYGKIKWAHCYNSTYKWGAATFTLDGGLVISNVSSVFKINKDGKVIWAKSFTVIGSHDINKIVELSDDGILLNVASTGSSQGFIFKLDKNGNLLWVKGINNKNNSNNYWICVPLPQPEGSFILAGGGIINAYPNELRSHLLQINAAGEISKLIYPKNSMNISQVLPAGKGFFISGTYNSSFLALAKINTLVSNGCFDTSSISLGFHPEIVGTDFSVNQHEINFNERELPLTTYDLELQEDTLCYDCKKPELNLGNDTTLCAGEILTLNAGVDEVTYEWSTGEKTAAIKIEKEGTYWLKVTNECGSVADTININYNKEPEFKTKISQLVANPWDEIQFSDSTAGIKNRYWDFGDSTYSESAKATHVYGKNGNFEVKLLLEDSSGCRYSIIKNVKILFESHYLPNAFSPDGNGLNDTFGLIGYGVENYRFKIYNRWGELIFDKENKGWDGKLNGENCPAGMYLYMLEAVFEKEIVNRNGYFYLER